MTDRVLTDPLGRQIVLHDRTWFGHIVRGHPEVKTCREIIERAIRDPDEIRFSLSDQDCRLYFASGPRSSIKVMVVADVAAGLVKTAHFASHVTGGTVEWSK